MWFATVLSNIPINFKIIMCMGILHAWMCMPGACGVQKRESDSLELELSLWAIMWVLGTDPVPSGWDANALNCWSVSSAPHSFFCSWPFYSLLFQVQLATSSFRLPSFTYLYFNAYGCFVFMFVCAPVCVPGALRWHQISWNWVTDSWL